MQNSIQKIGAGRTNFKALLTYLLFEYLIPNQRRRKKKGVVLPVLVCIGFFLTVLVTTAASANGINDLPESTPPALSRYCYHNICYKTLGEAESVMKQGAPERAAFTFERSLEYQGNNIGLVYGIPNVEPIFKGPLEFHILGCEPACYSEEEAVQAHASREKAQYETMGCSPSGPFVTGTYHFGSRRVWTPQAGYQWYHGVANSGHSVDGVPKEPRRVEVRGACPGGTGTSYVNLVPIQGYTCPAGWSENSPVEHFNASMKSLYDSGKWCVSSTNGEVILVKKSQVESCAIGHPCHPATGDKSRLEVDFTFAGRPFARHYHSLRELTAPAGFGLGWTHSFFAKLTPATGAISTPEGYFYTSTIYAGTRNAIDGDPLSTIERMQDGSYELKRKGGDVLVFDSSGLLQRIDSPQDPQRAVRLSYVTEGSESILTAAVDARGRRIQFIYTGVRGSGKRIKAIILPDGSSVEYGYNANASVSSAGYAGSQSKLYLYDEPGNSAPGEIGLLTGIVSEDGQRYGTFKYDAYGRVVSSALHGESGDVEKTEISYLNSTQTAVKTMAGEVLTYTYTDNFYRKPVLISGDGYSESIDYYRWQVVERTDRNGWKTRYSSGDYGRISSITDAANDYSGLRRTTELDWNADFGFPTETRTFDAGGTLIAKEAWTYNPRGQVLTHTILDPGGGTSRTVGHSYCENVAACGVIGLLTSTNGPRVDVADVTSYIYYLSDNADCQTGCSYRNGDLRRITNALGHSFEVLEYDSSGRALSEVDVNGVLHKYSYDKRGLLLFHRVVGGGVNADRVTKFEYWPTGLVSGITLPDGSYTGYAYDAAHRLTDVLDGDGNRIHYTLDGSGKRIKEEVFGGSNTLKRSLSRVYDVLGRMTTEKGAYGHGPTYGYDSNGNAISTKNAQGVKNTVTYDALNRLTQSLQDIGGIAASTQFKYDALDNLIEVTDPKGLKTSYSYDGLGQLRILTSPDTGTTQRTYDEAGNVKTITDARGVIVTHTYDALNRLTSKSYPNLGEDVAYTYDTVPAICASEEGFGVGRLSSMADYSGRTDYCYNRFGEVVRKAQITNGKTFVVRYTYTTGGKLASVIYPDGAVADYVRDTEGRITEVGVSNGVSGRQVLLTGVGYLPFGPSTGWQYGNGRVLVRSFDMDYRPTAVVDSGNDLKIGLGYDSVSNITSLESGNYAAGLKYDNLGRLTEHRDTAANVAIEQYSYDPTGNRLSFANAGGTTPYGYDASSHRLTSMASVSRGYDAVGNTVSALSGAKSYVYNQANRLSQVKLGGVTVQNYAHNARGERVQRGLDAASTVYTTYDETGRWLGDYDSLGNATQQVIWMDDMPVGLLAEGVLHYIEPDHLGTPRLVFNPMRNVPVWTWDIKGEAFGDTVPNQDPDSNSQAFVFDMRFPGQRYDAASGLNYNYFRDYDPSSGRYVQSDPIGLGGGPSTYAYSRSMPTGAFDPKGLTAVRLPPYGPGEQLPYGTIYCDDGVVTPFVNWDRWPSYDQNCIGDCLLAHEQSHARDATRSNPGVCRYWGWVPFIYPKGVVGFDRQERLSSEFRAYAAELRCLAGKLAKDGACTSDMCQKVIKSRIDDIVTTILPTVYNGTYPNGLPGSE